MADCPFAMEYQRSPSVLATNNLPTPNSAKKKKGTRNEQSRDGGDSERSGKKVKMALSSFHHHHPPHRQTHPYDHQPHLAFGSQRIQSSRPKREEGVYVTSIFVSFKIIPFRPSQTAHSSRPLSIYIIFSIPFPFPFPFPLSYVRHIPK